MNEEHLSRLLYDPKNMTFHSEDSEKLSGCQGLGKSGKGRNAQVRGRGILGQFNYSM